LTLACTKSKRFEITIPAEIGINQEIKNIAPINRESSDISSSSMNELIRNMTDAKNPRFSLADQKRSQNAYTYSRAQEGQVLSQKETETICKRAEVEGILALEKFRHEKDWDFGTYTTQKETRRTITEDGKEREQVITEDVTMHRASFSLDMHTDWKLYACTGEIVDTNRKASSKDWRGEGESRSDAKAVIGETDDLIAQMAKELGMNYFRRISPYEISVKRKYYPSGHKKIKLGNDELDNGDYKEAERLFREASEEATKKKKGKALYNLAMTLEITDRVEKALDTAINANRYLQNDMSQNYVEVLRKRKADLDQLREQLGQ
jgi:hypothetical protein